jgi:hypothetical protein
MPTFRQNDKPLESLPVRLLRYAEYLASDYGTKTECMRKAGLAEGSASNAYIGPSRERSRYPSLWDYYQKLRDRRLRLFDVNAETIRDELKLIAFSKITNYIHIPTRRDVARQKLFDAKIRKEMGYTDTEDQALLAQEDQLREMVGNDDPNRKFKPGESLKLKCLEDIPEELIPAIASIRETKDGISIKLWNKLDALDKLARICKLYDAEDEGSKATVIENLTVMVNGSKSDLLKEHDLKVA